LKDIDYFDEFLSVCEDYDFFLRISRKYHLLYLNKVTTRYRITESSISGKLGLREYRYREHDAKMLETHLHDASPEYVPLIRKRIWESYRIAAWGYLQLNDLKKVRELCFCSLRYKMIQPKVYVYFLISFLPISSINILKRIKHLLCQK